MTTLRKYEDTRLNPEYVDYLEREVRKLEKIKRTIGELSEEYDTEDCVIDILKILS